MYKYTQICIAISSIILLFKLGKEQNLYFLIGMHTMFLIITYIITHLMEILCPNLKIQKGKDSLKTLFSEYLTGFFPIIIWNSQLITLLTSDYSRSIMNINYAPTDSTLFYLFQIIIQQFSHDIYVFAVHKYILHSKYFWFMHKTHHIKTPSLMTAFTLSVWENAIQSIDLIITANIFGMHNDALMASLTFATMVGLYSHIGYELFPSWWSKCVWTNWYINTSYHDLHHSNGNCNYGYILTCYDKLTGSYKSV